MNKQELIDNLLEWAKQRKHEETHHRPDTNIHKQTLVQTWNQVINKLEEIKDCDE